MVAPVNPRASSTRSESAGRGGGAASWLTPSAVARASGGAVLQRGRTALTVSTDSRVDCEGQLFVALRGPNHDGHDHIAEAVRRGARGLLVSRPLAGLPGLDRLANPPFVVHVPDTGAGLLALASEHRRRHRAKVVGITGSCGKTTTKDWLAAVLAAAMPTVQSPGSFNNQIGVPLTLFQVRPETRAAVVEIGTNAPGEIAQLTAVARPDIAIVTCVAQAHLQGLGSLEGVAKEKASLPLGIDESGLCVLNGDDGACRAMAEQARARVQLVAIDRPADWFASDVRFHALGTSFLLQGKRPVTLPRLGTHNVYNALLVIAAASELGVAEAQILQVLTQVPPAPRRLEPKIVDDIIVFDDTYNMNPKSARAGLQALAGMPGPGRRIVVFGEMLELGEHSTGLHRDLGAAVTSCAIDELVCVGNGSLPIADGAIAAGMAAAKVHSCADVAAALQYLLAAARAGDRILCKASRRVALDRLVDGFLLARGHAGTSPPAAQLAEGG